MRQRTKLQKYFSAVTVLMLGLATTTRAQTQPDTQWMRLPEITAPYMDKAPVIDGQMEKSEWLAAASTGPLLVATGYVADENPRNVWIGYDAQNLYIAFHITRPDNTRKPVSPAVTGRFDAWHGDFGEIMLDIKRDGTMCDDFAIYSNGAYADGKGTPSMEKNWNPTWQRAARLTATGWEGEVAIPFASLGLTAPPPPGTEWGFDFVDNQTTPFRQQSHFSPRGEDWHNYKNFGTLRFGATQNAAPAVRFLQAGQAGEGHLITQFEMINPGTRPQQVQAHIQLLRRKEGAAGGAKPYYANIESGRDYAYEKGLTDFSKTTKLSDLIADTLTGYEPVAGADKKQAVSLPPGERRSFGVMPQSPPGEYLAVYEFRTATGTPLLAGVRPFAIKAPLSLTLEPYWLKAKMIRVQADLRKVSYSAGAKVLFSLLDNADAKDAKALQQATVAAPPDTPSIRATLLTGDLKPGYYSVEAKLIAADGKTLAVHREPVRKPEIPVWFNSDYGRRVKVPQPWTPLHATPEGQVTVWGRTYDLNTLLPKQITSQGNKLLPSPLKVLLKQGGKATSDWRVTQLKLLQADEGKAVYSGTLENDLATISGTASIEFDGFIWYDLKLTSKVNPLQVNALTLEMPLASQHAKLLNHHTFLNDPLINSKPPKPVKEGPNGVLAESLLPFTPALWMGDESGGLSWFAEGPVDWHVTKPNEVLEIQPAQGNQPALLRVHMIDAPTALQQPMRLQFGLQASPERPMPPMNVVKVVQRTGFVKPDGEYYHKLAEAGATVSNAHSGWKGYKNGNDWGGWPSPPSNPKIRKIIKEAVQAGHKYGLKMSLYTGWGIDTDSEAWKDFRYELARYPLENAGFGSYRQAAGLDGVYIDYMAWAIADLIKEYDIDGVFWDSAGNLMTDQNLGIGNGWVDHRGRVHPTYPVRATRELFKRVYTLTHGGLKEGGVVTNFGGSIWCINDFADIFHRGEGNPMHVKKLRDAWEPLEDYRANYDGRAHGLAALAMNKNFQNLPMTVNTYLAVTLLHGWFTKSIGYFTHDWTQDRTQYGHMDQPEAHIWHAWDWLPMNAGTRNYFYYDKAPQVVTLQPASLLSSIFVSSDNKRAMVVVSNLDDTAVKDAQVKLNLPGLGFKPSASLTLKDAILGKPVAIGADGAFKVDLAGERYRLLELEAK